MIVKEKTKHAEFTFGVHHQGLYDAAPNQGFTLMSNDDVVDKLKGLDEWVMGARRSLIGKLALLRQGIVYAPAYKVVQGPKGLEIKFLVYRRNKANGESRMAGSLSIGPGGHLELDDISEHVMRGEENEVIYTGSVDLMESLEESFVREFSEEVALYNAEGHNVSEAVMGAISKRGHQRIGFVWDGLPEEQPKYVGSTHFGVVYLVEVPHDVERFEMTEPMNDSLGWISLSDLDEFGGIDGLETHLGKVDDNTGFEPWSRAILENLPAIQQVILEVYQGGAASAR